MVRKAGELAKTGVNPTENLAKLFVDLKKTGGWDGLTELIYGSAASLNGFDKYGHYGRTRVTLSTCFEYVARPGGTEGGGCTSRFNGPGSTETAETSAAALYRLIQERSAEQSGGTLFESGPAIGIGQSDSTGSASASGKSGIAQSSNTEGTEPLLDYLLGQ